MGERAYFLRSVSIAVPDKGKRIQEHVAWLTAKRHIEAVVFIISEMWTDLPSLSCSSEAARFKKLDAVGLDVTIGREGYERALSSKKNRIHSFWEKYIER
jgi:hypothetical protein